MGRVLVADDEESDWLLLQMAFTKAGIPVQLSWVRDGVEAVENLREDSAPGKPAGGAEQSRTALLLLDLKMPRMSGFEVLEWWREQPDLAQLPVVVFTSSANPDDMERSRVLGAREHVVKPTGFDNLVECVQRLTRQYLPAHSSSIRQS